MTKARTLLSVKKNYFLRAFLWGVGLSFLFFLPFIIMNDGYFFFYGDFNVLPTLVQTSSVHTASIISAVRFSG